jgi:DnaJ-domain-containing protein 1
VRNAPDVADATGRDYATLSRMLADAETLCATNDALLAGQYRHLRGRIAALLALTLPPDGAEATP